MWGIDLVGPLPVTSGGYQYICVAVDYATRWPIAVPIKRSDHASVQEVILKHIIYQFGCPKTLISDNAFHTQSWSEP